MQWMTICFVFMVVTSSIPRFYCQRIDIQDLNNNNGYVPIKIEEVKIIKDYTKVLHIVNLTEYEITKEHIRNSLNLLKPNTSAVKPMFDTIHRNFILLEEKIKNLHPHPRPRQKRGLINILGKGLKFVAGTMDSDDEKEINNKLKALSEDDKILTNRINKQILLSNGISAQIRNITAHINKQQNITQIYLNSVSSIIQDKILTLEDEVAYIQYAYQINNDITLLRNHVDDIMQVIFSSKLGILSKDILTKSELELIEDFESYQNIRTVVRLHGNKIVIILFIPKYSQKPLNKIRIEPIPNEQNKSIHLEEKEVLVDPDNRIYKINPKDNLQKNLIEIKDDCINNIIKFKEAKCNTVMCNNQEIEEIIPGMIILKNVDNLNVTQNCNKGTINLKGNFLIRFENCRIEIGNDIFTNANIKVYDSLILPNFVTKIKEYKTLPKIELKELYLKQLDNEKNVEEIVVKNRNNKVISFGTDIIITIIVITLILTYFYCKCKRKGNITPEILNTVFSSEPQSNGGGVTCPIIFPTYGP